MKPRALLQILVLLLFALPNAKGQTMARAGLAMIYSRKQTRNLRQETSRPPSQITKRSSIQGSGARIYSTIWATLTFVMAISGGPF